MKTYTINQQPFEYDETRKHADFFICQGERRLVEIDWHELLRRLESGDMAWQGVAREILLLTRWVHEAPRKRFYHELGSDSRVVIASGEEFFIGLPGGPAIINALEATGQVAAALCRHHGLEPLAPIGNQRPDPVPVDSLVPATEDMPPAADPLPNPKEFP